MFDNIGGKIKGLAKTVCWIGIGVSDAGPYKGYKYTGDAHTLDSMNEL